MRRFLFSFVLVLTASVTIAAATPHSASAQDVHMEKVKRVLSRTPLIDGHNDLPWAIRNFESAPMDVAAYDLRGTAPGHDIARQIIAAYPDHFELALTASDIERIYGSGKIASLLGMEGGHAIENSLGALRAFFDLGVRYMTLTHWATVDWADAATDSARHGGLNSFGEEVIREMNRMGMLVDLSHVSPATMSDVLNVSRAPVIFSHSSAKGLRDHPRNVPDSILARMPENGGVVMVNFVPSFLTYDGNATIATVADHIEHVRNVAGIDHVGIGSDFDGIESEPVGLEDTSTYPALFVELSRRGWSEDDLAKLAGENVLRAMRGAERAARLIQRERGPSTATFEELSGGGGEVGSEAIMMSE
jgi:membrane dipeptidase